MGLDFVGFQDSRRLVVHFALDRQQSLVPVFALFLQLEKLQFIEAERQLGLAQPHFLFLGENAGALIFDNAAHRNGLLAAAVAEDLFGGGRHGGGSRLEMRQQVGYILRREFLQLALNGLANAASAGRLE